MVFSSSVFLLIFLPVILIGYYLPFLSKNRTYKNTFLLFGSLVFYAWGEPVFVLLMIFSIIITWLIGLLMAKTKRLTPILLGGGVPPGRIVFI